MPEPLEQRDVPPPQPRIRASGSALDHVRVERRSVDLRAGDRLQCRGRAGVVIVPVGEQDLGDTHILRGTARDLGQREAGALIAHNTAVEEDEPGRLPDRVDRDDRGVIGSRASR